jgi:NAD(P)-dependent dehydrogenase (short-subunit alcohol dehydrogenase family)
MTDPYFDLSDKVALVTGGSRGLGYEMVKAFAERGADCIIASRKLENCEAVAEEVRQLGRRALAVQVHAAKWPSIDELIETAYAEMGRVDILVNNAGWTATTPALEVTEEEYDKTLTASLKSVFFACQAAARVMIPQGGGKIINIGSNFGVVGFQGRSVYAAAKAGVHHLSRALSLEWARQGVLVNVVAPCITETDSRKVILERPGYKEWATTQMLPAGRWNQPEDLVGAVLFLSSSMSDMVVGHVLMVDGGWTIH